MSLKVKNITKTQCIYLYTIKALIISFIKTLLHYYRFLSLMFCLINPKSQQEFPWNFEDVTNLAFD